MSAATQISTTRFPWWIVGGGALLALVYLPTLAAPFDFIDDGDLVYPVATPTFAGQFEVWWDRVADNVAHLGPFRPVLHAQWQIQANLLNADPLAWRAMRLGWCALSAILLLWLLRELKCHPVAALVAAAAAMWNPYRNEIWTSLTLAEGVAMPYAMLALIGARKAAFSQRPWRWDAVAVFGLLMALGCKNIFVALVPAMAVLRWSNGFRWRAAVYLLPVLVPVAHFVYFKLNWKPGNYEMAGPTWAQVGRFWLWMKGAAGADFLGAGVAAVLACVYFLVPGSREPRPRGSGDLPPKEAAPARARLASAPLLAAVTLLFAGFAVYLPMGIMSPRYTMPAVWGVDIFLALLLTRFLAIPDGRVTRVAWSIVGVGLLVTVVASVGRQDKLAARSRMLWEVVEHLEQTTPIGEPVAWVGGDSSAGALNVEEGIHVYWHLKHRDRGDIRIGLFDATGASVTRVELPPLDQPPRARITAGPSDSTTWELTRTFTQPYRLGRKRFECRLETATKAPPTFTGRPVMPSSLPATGQGFALDPFTATFMKESFANPGHESETLLKLRPKVPGINGAADLLIDGGGK